jgi:putative transposase
VTKRLHRYYGTHDLHFITGSCYHREPELDSVWRRDLFLTILEEARCKYRFVVHGYVVMPEHFHLLIAEPEIGDPSVVMKVIKERFSRQLNQKRKQAAADEREGAPLIASFAMSGIPRREPAKIWQKRFYDFNVWTEYKHIEKLRYMHRNPVKRGLVEKPEQWKWSSFRAYLYGEPGPVRVNFQEWALEIKTHPVQSFGEVVGHPLVRGTRGSRSDRRG